MLTHLHISHYALIEHLDIDMPAGLCTVTGETGAGKSIMLGALSLLLGTRADSRRASVSDKKTVVEGTFLISPHSATTGLLTELDLDAGSRELILRREITPSGRSRAFINDTPVNVATLARVASHELDIHSQHANLLISDPAFQLDMIDAYGSLAPQLAAYREIYDRYRRTRTRLLQLREQQARVKENEEFILFRLEHLRRLNLKAGEQEQLEKRLAILSASSSLSEYLGQARAALDTPDTGALDSIDNAAALLRRVDLSLLDSDDNLLPRLDSLRIELADIASTLASYLDRVEADPAELERVEARLDDIYEAGRRFNAPSEADLLALKDSLENDYAQISGEDSSIQDFENQLHELAPRLKAAAEELTAARVRTASEIASRLLQMARPLGMHNLRLSFSIASGKLTATGADTPSLLVAFNKNQELSDVRAVASGGEVSRLMLCLKSIMAERMQLPTIIFDEVDTGVSGDTAFRMARLMRDISKHLGQVIVVTHLPQVAAMGQSQLKVYKEDAADATHTHLRLLSPSEREQEIAAMLSADGTSEAALLNARALLNHSTNPLTHE